MGSGFAIVDLFAGPGGLAEGFSAVRAANGSRPFRIALSIEMDAAAHSTLLLRSFLRQFPSGPPAQYYEFLNGGGQNEPTWHKLFPDQWKAAEKEAVRLKLGADGVDKVVYAKLDAIRDQNGGNTILIGGPPCQAYSLVGRARNQNKEGYVAENDHRHRLYEEYVRILERLKPAAFVMENVKGMLSSSLDGSRIFERVLSDLRSAGGADNYQLVALARPTQRGKEGKAEGEPTSADFIIRAEDFGLPQARHRVIVVGIRRDVYVALDETRLSALALARREKRVTVDQVIGDMPKLRSGLSRKADTGEAWASAFADAANALLDMDDLTGVDTEEFNRRVIALRERAKTSASRLPRCSSSAGLLGESCPDDLRAWLTDPNLTALVNNQTRGHMPSDLTRYLFTSIYGEMTGGSPKAGNFPPSLAPDHRNWTSGKFADRFRVQLSGAPSTTVTSHIAKDGHYFIHPDPAQCRSLTVREAARLQTFPDNYIFKGNRTEQFTQVGNAVPPFLAKQIGDALYAALSAMLAKSQADPSSEPRQKIRLRARRQPRYSTRLAARRTGSKRG